MGSDVHYFFRGEAVGRAKCESYPYTGHSTAILWDGGGGGLVLNGSYCPRWPTMTPSRLANFPCSIQVVCQEAMPKSISPLLSDRFRHRDTLPMIIAANETPRRPSSPTTNATCQSLVLRRLPESKKKWSVGSKLDTILLLVQVWCFNIVSPPPIVCFR